MPTPQKIHAQNGYQYFARYDEQTEIYEVFLEPECEAFVGNADTLSDAKQVAQQHAEEMASQ